MEINHPGQMQEQKCLQSRACMQTWSLLLGMQLPAAEVLRSLPWCGCKL